nr:DUF1653 domain-containing protein [uncultured Agathobacter sp.]
MDRTPKPGELYRHFKNKLYQIVTVATHSETGEKLVIYQALYDDFGVYARPLDMFVSEVDHEKYPDVKQKYRFERVTIKDKPEDMLRKSISSDANVITANAPENVSVQAQACHEPVPDVDEGQAPNPRLMEFLDADTFEEKYNILVSMRDTITDRLIDDIAVVMDVVVPEGPLQKRYDDLKNTIKTRQYYEFSNRLR